MPSLWISVTIAAFVLGAVLSLVFARVVGLRRGPRESDAPHTPPRDDRLSAVYEALACGVIVRNADGSIAYTNQAAREILGIPTGGAERWVPEASVRIFTERGVLLPAEQWPMARALRSGLAVRDELVRIDLGDARERWVIADAVALTDGPGTPVTQAIMSMVDVTAQRRAEQQYRTIVDTVGEVIYQTNADGRWTFLNPAWKALTGYDASESLFGDCFAILHPDDRVAIVEQFGRLVTGEQNHNRSEARYIHRDGKVRWIEIHSRATRSAGGRVIGTSGTLRDITDRKTIEVAERKARVAAEASSRAKSEFMANMSHEIRTPMNGVGGMLDLVLGTELTREQREHLEIAKSSTDSLLTVINDVLDFSKIEAGRIVLDAQPFHLRDSLDDAVASFGARAHHKGIELAVEVAPDVPDALIGDWGRLRQVFVNLVANALKFTEHGEIVVTVAVEKRRDAEVRLHGAVRDTGIGIPKEKHVEIFDAFTQADSSTTRLYGGTGLGLTISARLVQAMGGRMWLESDVGKGSTFHFSVACTIVGGAPDARVGPLVEVVDCDVLVVDDNATNRMILERMLTNWRLHPSSVGSGAAALAALTRAADAGRPYAFMLLDADMPGMDGFAVAEEVRRRPELVQATLMMLGPGARPSDIARCRDLGIPYHIAKPVRQSQLLDAIMTGLHSTGHDPALDEPPMSAAGGSPRPMHVLVVEDNAVNQRLAVGLLERRGHRVALVANGRDAVDAVAREHFDVVLMDVQMPIMGGMEATSLIRTREKGTGRHVPIVALTAHAMSGDRDACLEAGMDAYVAKPINAEELFRTLGGLMTPLNGDAAVRTASAPITESAKPESVVLDADEFLRLSGEDPELVRELAQIFIDEYPRLLQTIRDAIDRKDASALADAAHTLKGASSSIAAPATRLGAARLESMGRSADLTGAGAVCDTLSASLDALHARLDLIARGEAV